MESYENTVVVHEDASVATTESAVATDISFHQELACIRTEISSLNQVVSRMLEQSHDNQMNMRLSELRSDISKPLINYLIKDSKNTLNNNMCVECEQRTACMTAFEELLRETALLLMDHTVDDRKLLQYEKRFEEIRELATTDNCIKCTSNASDLFKKQLELIRSFSNYGKERSYRPVMGITEIPDELVSCICEPLANKQRLSMLRSLSLGTKSFSELSKITGLRGGNLLFHIQKLNESGLISQMNERGDYYLTKRGRVVLQGLASLYMETLEQ